MTWRWSEVTTTALDVGEGFPPLDDQLHLWDGSWSEGLAKQAVWLLGLLPDDRVEEIFLRVGQLAVTDTSVWRRGAKWGERLRAVQEAEAALAKALPQAGASLRGERQIGPKMGVAIDGCMVHIREEGYKELKVGDVFEVEMRPEAEGGAGLEAERAHAVANSYVGVLGGPDRFGAAVWGEASRRGWAKAKDTLVLGDGAVWIWNVAREHFGYSLQGVDWYHAKEHLYQVGHTAFNEGSTEAIRWAKSMETPLYQGHAALLAEAIADLATQRGGSVAGELQTEAGYFRRNQHRMQYMDLREQGWPIGSGMVESGCKQFAARLTGPGMCWSRAGAERMTVTRAAIMSRRFDALWPVIYSLPPN